MDGCKIILKVVKIYKNYIFLQGYFGNGLEVKRFAKNVIDLPYNDYFLGQGICKEDFIEY